MQAIDFLIADTALCHALTEQGKAADLVCASFASLESALRAWRDREPSLILVDAALLNANDEDRLVEAVSVIVPTPRLVFLGVPNKAIDLPRAECFEKPFRLGALLARIRLLQNKEFTGAGKTYRLGPWLFAPDERQATQVNGPTVRFTDKETALLTAFCDAPAPIAKESLLAEVWGYDSSTDTHTLETHLYKLRRKLACEDEDPFDVDQGLYALKPEWRPR